MCAGYKGEQGKDSYKRKERMIAMFCKRCGSKIMEGMEYCSQCGYRNSTGTDVPENQEERKSTAKGKNGRKAVNSVLAVIIVIILGVFLICLSTIYSIREATSEESIGKLTRELDFSKIKVDIFGEDSRGVTLAEFISDNTHPDYKMYLDDSSIEELLKQKFVRKFAEKKLNDYIGDLFDGTGEGEFTRDEFVDLLNDNMYDIYQVTGLYMDENTVSTIADDMGDDFFQSTSLYEIRSENHKVFEFVRWMFSYWMMIVMGIIIILLIGCVIMIQDRKAAAASYVGTGILVAGIIDIVIACLNGVAVDVFNSNLPLGRKFWQLILESVRSNYIQSGCILVVTGVVVLIVKAVIIKAGNWYRSRQKKQ